MILAAFNKNCASKERFQDPSHTIKHDSQVIAFVDDNNILSSYVHLNPHDIFSDIVKKFQYWQTYLQTTGGILNQEKTSIYTWKWSIKNTKVVIKNIRLTQFLTSETFKISNITESYKFLGIHSSPTQTMNANSKL